MESASSRPVSGGGDLLRCGFCPSSRAPYTCPRCLLRFCSVPCFRGHGSCARDFRERELRLRLQGLRGGEASSRGRLREALLRLRELREPGDEQARLGLGPEEAPLWEQLTPEEQKAFRKLLGSGGAASLVPLWTPWWEEGPAPRGLVREVGPRDPPKAGGGDLIEPGDPQNPLRGEERGPQVTGGENRDLAEEVDPLNPLQGGKWDLIVEMDHQKTLEREESDLIVEMDPQKTLEREESDLLKETDPRKPLERKDCDLIVEMDPQKPLEREESDLIKEMDPRNPLQGGKWDLIVETDHRKTLERKDCDLIVEMDPRKILEREESDVLKEMDPRNPSQCAFTEEIDPLPRGKRALIEEIDPQKEREGSDLINEIEKTDPQNPFKAEERDRVKQKDPQNPLQGDFIEERDPQKPLRGAFIEKADPRDPLEAEEHVLMDERGLESPSQGKEEEEGVPRGPAKPLCETEAARLLRLIPPEIPPLSSFRTSVSPSVGFQLPGVLYGYVYALSLYNGDVEGEEDVLGEFCETLLDVSPPLGSSARVYGSVSEALQDASRCMVDHRYPECPLGRGGAMSAVARLLSQKAFLLAALCHLGKLLRKGRKRMADPDRSQAFRAGKKCAFLLSWANENEGLLPLLALAAREEGRSQREAGQEVGALRRGLERKWRGKRPPREEKKEKALIEELD
nr:zinc finger HIT domain-containing protein 2 [Anolis sagrei ordinatus]